MEVSSSLRALCASTALALLGACADESPQSPGAAATGEQPEVELQLYGAGDQSHRRACGASEYRQFDFWVGKWDVTEVGSPPGTNLIRKALDGCAVLESFASAGFVGRSINAYDAATRRWHQHWVDHVGTVLTLSGGIENGSMVLEGVRPLLGGASQVDRITWSRVGQGDVRQYWVYSTDGGATFPNVQFDGLYRRLSSLNPEPEVPQQACHDPTLPVLDELDYTLGEWKVEVAGALDATGLRSRITKELSDCLIEERIEGKDGYKAIVYSSVRRRLGIWERTFVDNRGANAILSGSSAGGQLILTGTAPSRHRGALDVRVTFTRKSDDRFVQRWERTPDGGATWNRLLVLTYRRK